MTLDVHHEKQFHPWRWLLLVVLIALLGLTGWYAYRWYSEGEVPPIPLPAGIIVQADTSIDESDVTPDQVAEHVVPATNPRYISIPSIGVGQTRVLPVGVTESGELGVPANINDAAWYNQSATPGSGGAVLIDGHNGGVTRNGVFAKLGTLSRGDTIVVERGDGETFTYAVREVQSMPLEQVNDTGMAMMLKSAQEGVEGLNLITCDGNWVPALGTFSHRVMLRAALVS